MLSLKRRNTASSRDIAKIFSSTNAKIYNFPILFTYTSCNKNETSIGFIIPKKKIKKATYRNKIRRLLKAQYQDQVNAFASNIIGAFIYLPDKKCTSKIIHQSIKEIIESLNKKKCNV